MDLKRWRKWIDLTNFVKEAELYQDRLKSYELMNWELIDTFVLAVL